MERKGLRLVERVPLGVVWLEPQVERLTTLLATRAAAQLLPDGDYSEKQLDHVTQQAFILFA